ncbi:hypothetical protein PVAG01_09695 [Phlyctema vagabunda]|uniref:Uncharacterized protein n=1 Tax=Phlyctema vagabunda TaxID=108571 RepID=A0ABR4P836_9HELO
METEQDINTHTLFADMAATSAEEQSTLPSKQDAAPIQTAPIDTIPNEIALIEAIPIDTSEDPDLSTMLNLAPLKPAELGNLGQDQKIAASEEKTENPNNNRMPAPSSEATEDIKQSIPAENTIAYTEGFMIPGDIEMPDIPSGNIVSQECDFSSATHVPEEQPRPVMMNGPDLISNSCEDSTIKIPQNQSCLTEADCSGTQTHNASENLTSISAAEEFADGYVQVIATEITNQEGPSKLEASTLLNSSETEVVTDNSVLVDLEPVPQPILNVEEHGREILHQSVTPMEVDDESLASKADAGGLPDAQTLNTTGLQEDSNEPKATISVAKSEVPRTNAEPNKLDPEPVAVLGNASIDVVANENLVPDTSSGKPDDVPDKENHNDIVKTIPRETFAPESLEDTVITREGSETQLDQAPSIQGKKRESTADIAPPTKRQSTKPNTTIASVQTSGRKRVNKNPEARPQAKIQKRHVQELVQERQSLMHDNARVGTPAKMLRENLSQNSPPLSITNTPRSTPSLSTQYDIVDLTDEPRPAPLKAIFKKAKRKTGTFPRYELADVYIELAHLDEIYTYSFNSTILEHFSEWFKSSLRRRVVEVDEEIARDFIKKTGYIARFELKWILDQQRWILQRAPHTTIEGKAPWTAERVQESSSTDQMSTLKLENAIIKFETPVKNEHDLADSKPLDSDSSSVVATQLELTKDPMLPPHCGGVPLPLLEAFNNLFRTYHNLAPNIDTENINNALEQSELLLIVAKIYGGVPMVRTHVNNIMLQYGLDIYKAVLIDPPRWLSLAAQLESAPIFKEAMVHVVGMWPSWHSNYSFDGLPISTRNLIMQKVEDLTILRHEANEKLLLASIQLAHHDHKIMLDPLEKLSFDTWVIVQIWRDWFCHKLTSLNTPGRNKYAIGKVYRQINEGGDAYLPFTHVHEVLQAFKAKEFARWPARVVRDHLEIMKSGAIDMVKDLVVNRSSINVEENGIEYLTCTKIENNELPWLG